ncbi:MAG: hypothetical protein OXU20_30725 [Myxococcales bacterium]|nr:hypothetical protein [Myxococcales bacterium]MDD9970132.1 hypothetical protein [Myxococcales bacterium]
MTDYARTEHATTEDAAQLVGFGLQPRLRPAESPAYAELLQRYRTEQGLREHTALVARGLGLVVLGETDHGLVLGAQDDGPFSLRLSDYRRSGLSVQERMLHGLIQLAIAAWCFPTAQALDDPDAVLGTRVSTHKLVDYLVGLCEELKDRTEADPEHGSPELQEAWRSVLSRAETRDGRRAPTTLVGMVAYALEFLERGGLMRRVSDSDGGTWQALGAYRLQVRELAAHALAEAVRDAAGSLRSKPRVHRDEPDASDEPEAPPEAPPKAPVES